MEQSPAIFTRVELYFNFIYYLKQVLGPVKLINLI